MRIIVLGDTHGQINAVRGAVVAAKDHKADRILQVGDFGLGDWGAPGTGMYFLDEVQRMLADAKIDLYAVPGNHEDHDEWERILKTQWHHKHDFYAHARTNIKLIPKVAVWQWDKKWFAAAGGAVSIDRQWRKEGVSWWPNEELHPKAAENFTTMQIDYLFTHDCSDKTPWGFQLVPDLRSAAHRNLIDTVLDRSTRPFIFTVTCTGSTNGCVLRSVMVNLCGPRPLV